MRWLFCHELLWKYSEVQSPNYSTWFSKGHPTVGHTSILLFIFFTSSVPQHLRWNTCFEKASACSPAPCCVQGQGTSSGSSQMLLLCWLQGKLRAVAFHSCWSTVPASTYDICSWALSGAGAALCCQSQVGFCLHRTWLPSASAELLCEVVPLVPAGVSGNLSANGRLVCGTGQPRSRWVGK